MPSVQPRFKENTVLAEPNDPNTERMRDFTNRANNLGINARFKDQHFSTDEAQNSQPFQKHPMADQSARENYYGSRNFAKKQDDVSALLKSNSAYSAASHPPRTSMKFDPGPNFDANANATQAAQYYRLNYTDNKYNRKPIGQQMLPTPPDSTSPEWSSSFAAFPNVLSSPDTTKAPIKQFPSPKIGRAHV